MTAEEFRDAAATLKPMTQKQIGAIIGKSVRTVRRYSSGEEAVPVLVAEKMHELAGNKRADEARATKKAARA